MSRSSGTHPRPRPGLSARLIVAVLAIAALLLPSAVPAVADPRAELEDVTDQLGEARDDLHDVNVDTQKQQEDLAQVEARQDELAAQLAVLNADLADAEDELADAEAKLERTTVELTATQARLEETRQRLTTYRNRFVDRARHSYMYGGSAAFTFSLVQVDNLSDFGRAMKYARAVLEADQRDIETVEALERNIDRDSRDLVALQEDQAALEAAAQTDRDGVAAVVAEREAVAAEAAAEAQRHETILGRLADEKQRYVAMVNDLEAQSSRLEDELAQLAAAAEAERQRREAAAAAAARSSADPPAAAPEHAIDAGGTMLWPASGPLTSSFGWRTHPIFGTRRFHAGIDIGAGYGSSIWAADDGVVYSAGWVDGYGNAVIIDHGGGLATLYGHQSSVAVSSGQSVSRGDTIGYVGSTGYSTGPHLHFEVRVNGSPQDPMNWL